MTFEPGHKPAPKRPDVTQFQPGDSSTVKMLKVVAWALRRGGTFSPLELKARFHCGRATAYRYAAEWRQVFGTDPPPRARVKLAQPYSDPQGISLDELLESKP